MLSYSRLNSEFWCVVLQEIHSRDAPPLKPSLLSQIHFLSGTSHTELGEYQTAIEHLNEAIHHVPTNALVWYFLLV